MGRHAGWIATFAGIAGGADCILVPEFPGRVEQVAEVVRHRRAAGLNFSIVVVAEGARPTIDDHDLQQQQKVDEFGYERLGGVGSLVAEEVERLTGIETRVTILGHVQRGGTPTANDRVLATRYGLAAVDLVIEQQWGMMTALHGREIVAVPLRGKAAKNRQVPKELFEIAEMFFG